MRLSAPVYHLKRRAKMLARNEKIPLHQAQDRIARDEGFAGWSLLSRHLATGRRETPLLRDLADGDMLLIAARPGAWACSLCSMPRQRVGAPCSSRWITPNAR
jgi:hypothetical protein